METKINVHFPDLNGHKLIEQVSFFFSPLSASFLFIVCVIFFCLLFDSRVSQLFHSHPV